MEPLTPRERLILKNRFVDHRTLSAVAEETGFSITRVRQLQARGLAKLGLQYSKSPEFHQAIKAALDSE